MRLALAVVLAVVAGSGSRPGPAWADEPEARPTRQVQITRSSAVVYVLDCPEGTAPTWQPLRLLSTFALPELTWLGIGTARVCGVPVGGVETEMILACQRPDGTHHGPVGSWYGAGQRRTEGSCRGGAAHGIWRRLHRDGSRAAEGQFDAGRRVGIWTLWEPDGRERTFKAATAGLPSVF